MVISLCAAVGLLVGIVGLMLFQDHREGVDLTQRQIKATNFKGGVLYGARAWVHLASISNAVIAKITNEQVLAIAGQLYMKDITAAREQAALAALAEQTPVPIPEKQETFEMKILRDQDK